MIQGQAGESAAIAAIRAPQVIYCTNHLDSVLNEPNCLALFGFGKGAPMHSDPRWTRVPLEPFDAAETLELWQIEGPVSHGRDGSLRWSRGGGWLFVAIELDEVAQQELAATIASVYARLNGFVATQPERHVLRVWNYLDAINQGSGDDERYRRFCEGRARGSGDWFAEGFPAATVIGHHGRAGCVQVYLLACIAPGRAVGNPRQLESWQYPRQYGRCAPGFARAMVLPADDALAISGTAAVRGHASVHPHDLEAQLGEILANLEALLINAGRPPLLDTHAPLKAYVRHASDAPRVSGFLRQHLPGVPVLLLHGDICRSELLVEWDGWRYGG